MKQLDLIKPRRKSRGVKWGRPASTFTGARKKRKTFSAAHPLHITLRLRDGLPNLRSRKGAAIVKHAMQGVQGKDLRILHFAILSNHIHLLCEGDNSQALYRAMKSFCSRMGLHNRAWAQKNVIQNLDKKGYGIFRGRYDVKVLKSPRQVKNALRYVLLNPSKHFSKNPYIDQFTSGVIFRDWKKLLGYDLSLKAISVQKVAAWKTRLNEMLSPPRLWLTSIGWQWAISVVQ